MNAIFCFAIVKRVNLQIFSEIVSKAITVAELTYTFSQFRVYLEEDTVKQIAASIPTLRSIGDHEGRIFRVNREQVETWLGEKRASEEKARTVPGHTSYRPSSTLSTDTCVIVIGSRAFAAVMARIHMEEIVTLRPKLIDILTKLCSLENCGAKSRLSHDDFLITSVKPDEKNYITYNLNWMADQVMRHAERPSHKSVMRRLSGESQ